MVRRLHLGTPRSMKRKPKDNPPNMPSNSTNMIISFTAPRMPTGFPSWVTPRELKYQLPNRRYTVTLIMMANGSASACPACDDIARLIKPKIVTTEPNIKQCFQVSLVLFRAEASLTRTLGRAISIASGTICIFFVERQAHPRLSGTGRWQHNGARRRRGGCGSSIRD